LRYWYTRTNTDANGAAKDLFPHSHHASYSLADPLNGGESVALQEQWPLPHTPAVGDTEWDLLANKHTVEEVAVTRGPGAMPRRFMADEVTQQVVDQQLHLDELERHAYIQGILTYAHVCWRMLTNADEC
jgi:hypothetical protein